MPPRTIVLEAPAGYGKSTFLRACAPGFERLSWCDCDAARDVADLRRQIVDALAKDSPATAVEVARLRLARGADASEEFDAVQRFWSGTAGHELFIFENADGLREIAGAHELIAQLAVSAPPGRALAFACRRPLPLAFERCLAHREIIRIGAPDLRLEFDAVVALALQQGLDGAVAHEIARLSGGWPIVARLLVESAANGAFSDLVVRLDDIAFDELYDFLADEVVTSLPVAVREALMVVVGVPGPTGEEIQRASAGRFDAIAERRLRLLPFVVRELDGTYTCHPLVRAMVATRYPQQVADALERVLAGCERDGEPKRAAALALAKDDPARAARALDRVPTYLRDSAVLPDCEHVIARLGAAGISQYPNLWVATIPFRRFSVDLDTYLTEARSVYYCLPPRADSAVRTDALLQLASALYQNGEFEESETILRDALETFAREPSIERATLLTFVASLRGLQGRYAEARALRNESAGIQLPDFLADLALDYIDAHEAIARGRYEPAMAIIEESLRRMKQAKLPLYIAYTATNGAIFAWAAGDDERFNRYIVEVEESLVPGIERGFASLLAAARGEAVVPDLRREAPVARAMAHLYRLGHAHSAEEAVDAALAAASEADRCRDPYVQVLAHAACVHLGAGGEDSRSTLLESAGRLESPEMSVAARAVTSGKAPYGILNPFVLARVAGTWPAAQKSIEIHLFTGRVVVNGQDVRVADKELELILYLATARTAVSRTQLTEAVWAHIEDDVDAANNLKVTLLRLRRRLGDRGAVIHIDGGYRLAPSVIVDVRGAEALVRECTSARNLSARHRLALYPLHRQIETGFPARYDRFAWFDPYRLRLREVAIAVESLLAADALANGDAGGALRFGRMLVDLDPLDERARRIVVEASIANGDRGAARREVEAFGKLLKQELDLEPSPELETLVGIARERHPTGSPLSLRAGLPPGASQYRRSELHRG